MECEIYKDYFDYYSSDIFTRGYTSYNRYF